SSSDSVASAKKAGVTAAAKPAPATTVAPTPPVEEVLEDSWIDTPLCTSCNDCFKINPLLFVYNDDKQAQLGDLKKGTYAQLVKAAELCPAGCIHPGQPWDKNEPDLDALMARARDLN
ncbi:hypothetical protein TI04_13630, partial [Achromatium sp. WMS2]